MEFSKHSLPCSVIGTPLNEKIRKVRASIDEDTNVITTLWILNDEISVSTLNELYISIDMFCKDNGLIILTSKDRHLSVSGTVNSYCNAFNTTISRCTFGEDTTTLYYVCNTETLQIPYEWHDKVVSIMGLDTYPCFHNYHIVLKNTNSKGLAPNGSSYFDPLQLATLYNFPVNLTGAGQKIGIIELGGGYVLSDITSYFSQLGLGAYTPNIVSVSVDGGTNNPADTSGASVEVILDIEIIASIVPQAAIRVYFAPNSFTGFYNAIQAAILDNCNAISISWGLAESYWASSFLTSYNNLFKTAVDKGITVAAASGDNGSKDGTPSNTVDFPSSSPNVLGCGGTRLVANSSKTTITSEVVWNNNSITSATGGGISNFFTRPAYQNSVSSLSNKKRGVPDICGVADPNTGYVVYSSAEGGLFVVGGTSAVSPLWTGLFARLNQSLTVNHSLSVGFLNTRLYSSPQVCRDVTQGNNGGFSASTGWDACTGLGSPNGVQILNALSNTVPPPTPTPAPAPTPPSNLPVASFTVSRSSGKAPVRITFKNTSTNALGYRWNFGDRSTSSAKNPIKTYTKPGTYSVTLVATNRNGSTTLTMQNLIVIQKK